ncbi:methyltransferase [Herbidospora sp. RD11066]
MNPRSLLHLLANGQKAIDVVRTSLDMGVFDALAEPSTVSDVGAWLGVVPDRLYKLLDCLETLGLVRCLAACDNYTRSVYVSVPGAQETARDVLAREADRDTYPPLPGGLPAVLRGETSIPGELFAWPPTAEQLPGFEKSMAAGLGPFVETFLAHVHLFEGRLLDVGGGDGTLAAALVERSPELRADVYNLPEAAEVVQTGERLGFVPGDFLAEALPGGYDVMSFVRVLHDWPVPTARLLLEKAHDALPPGGRIVISEEFRTPERLAAQFFWSHFLMGVDACVSRLHPIGHYERLLEETGFTCTSVLDGPVELITAIKE